MGTSLQGCVDQVIEIAGQPAPVTSEVALAPKVEAMSNSRTSPVMREANVSKETVDAALKRFTTAV